MERNSLKLSSALHKLLHPFFLSFIGNKRTNKDFAFYILSSRNIFVLQIPKNKGEIMRRQSQIATLYIQLYKKNCEACWKCISECPNQVIGRINILFHKHSRISEPDKCNGCLKCMKVCEYKAIRQITNEYS